MPLYGQLPTTQPIDSLRLVFGLHAVGCCNIGSEQLKSRVLNASTLLLRVFSSVKSMHWHTHNEQVVNLKHSDLLCKRL